PRSCMGRGARFRARLNRATTLYAVGPRTGTTMQSCASAAKLRMIVDARRWPAQDGRPVGRFGYLEVVDASDVLDNAVACVVSDVHAEGKTFAQDAQLKSIAACRTIAQCLNLEHEIHDTASKLCILGFEPLK